MTSISTLCDDAIWNILEYSQLPDVYTMLFVSKDVSHITHLFFEWLSSSTISHHASMIFVRTSFADIIFTRGGHVKNHGLLEKYADHILQNDDADYSIIKFDNKKICISHVSDDQQFSTVIGRSRSAMHLPKFTQYNKIPPKYASHIYFDEEMHLCFLIGVNGGTTIFSAQKIEHYKKKKKMVTLFNGAEFKIHYVSYCDNVKLKCDYIILGGNTMYDHDDRSFVKTKTKHVSKMFDDRKSRSCFGCSVM